MERLTKKETGQTSYAIDREEYEKIKTILSLKDPRSYPFPTPQHRANFFNQKCKLVDGVLYRQAIIKNGQNKKSIDVRVVYKEIAYDTIYQVHNTKLHNGNLLIYYNLLIYDEQIKDLSLVNLKFYSFMFNLVGTHTDHY